MLIPPISLEQVANAQWDICSRDLNVMMTNTAKAVGTSQMALHALALEEFTRVLQQLPTDE
eukprot:scaffold39224_cov31-Tisochrysis_lutea.AAC.6